MQDQAVINLIIPASGEVGAGHVGVLVPRQILSSLESQLGILARLRLAWVSRLARLPGEGG
jgi:hypothetical protein